ncbi:MAG: hypothetical protein GWN86_06930 [Desulfobacterales bacterium]|nr:hypothetical protein [Desulfobacterales bacterium]
MPINNDALVGASAATVTLQFLRRLNNINPQVLADIIGGIVEEWSKNFRTQQDQGEQFLAYLKQLQDGELSIDDLTISDDGVVPKTNKERPSKRNKSEKNGHDTEAILPENIIAS